MNLRARYPREFTRQQCKSSPQFPVEQAREIAHENSMSFNRVGTKRILVEKMGALYAVGMGSDNPLCVL